MKFFFAFFWLVFDGGVGVWVSLRSVDVPQARQGTAYRAMQRVLWTRLCAVFSWKCF